MLWANSGKTIFECFLPRGVFEEAVRNAKIPVLAVHGKPRMKHENTESEYNK
ncbi:hypothetical protein [Methanosarcina thermophila]|uniref:hypothetical protein n=1 Tax=Methanosarcina thermophila TaxID=2210 RepID=UPI0024910786|nr:hypothetical protein [Methanosarcina thermophila]